MENNRNVKILLVEDQVIISMEQSRMLTHSGFDVITARSGEKAVECVLNQGDIQLILMDVDLGDGMNGPQASEKILKIRNIPIVFLTSHTSKEKMEEVNRINRYGFVVKGTGNFVLLSAIDMALKLFDTQQNLKEREKNLRTITENMNEIFWLQDTVKNEMIYVSPAYEKIAGRSCQSLYSDPESFFGSLLSEKNQSLGIPQKDGIENQFKINSKIQIQRPDGQTKWVWASTYPIVNDEGKVIQSAGLAKDITEQKEVEEKLLESQRRFDCITNNSQILICEVGIDGRASFLNPAFFDILGYDPEEIKGKSFFELFHPEDIEMAGNEFSKMIRCGQSCRNTWRMRHKNGEYRWVECIANLYTNKAGERKVIVLSVDITSQKMAEEKIQIFLKEKELLLREVHHRIKNNMTLISSFLQLQAAQSQDPRVSEILNESNSRILTMMRIYDKLYVSSDFKNISVEGYLTELIAQLAMTFPDKQNILICQKIDPVTLDSQILFPIGIIINELVSNCLKYAFPQYEKGEIFISLKKTSDSQLELIVKDNGIGLPASLDLKAQKTFGLQLVSVFTRQLKSNAEILREGGTQFKINIPL